MLASWIFATPEQAAAGFANLAPTPEPGRLGLWPFVLIAILSAGLLFTGRLRRQRDRLEHRLRTLEQHDKQLVASASMLRTLIEAIPDLIWLKDTDGRYVTCNQRFARFFGAEESQIAGKTDFDFVDRQTAEFFLTMDRVAIEAGRPNTNEEEIRFADDGHVELLETIKAPVFDDRGTVYGVVGVGRNITARKRIEEQLRKLGQAVDQMASSVVITDTTGQIQYVNPAFTRNTGYTAEEAIGENPRILKSGRQPDALYANMWATLTSGQTWRGELENRRKDGSFFWELATIAPVKNDSGTVTHYVAVKDDITPRKEVERELVTAARTDNLTGLANRVSFQEKLEEALDRARAAQGHIAVLFLDFDRFKTINDSLGHDTGDLLLREIAARLRAATAHDRRIGPAPAEPVVARFGGDEFVVLLEAIDDMGQAVATADRILEGLAQPYDLAGHEVYSTASIGIRISDGRDGEHPADLLRDADTAMYESKLAGRGRCTIFDDSMRQRVQRRMSLENDLRRAIDREELFVLYQPIVCLQTGKLDRCEALVRWQHPEHGLISPGEFIPIAEETGLIVDIGRWVLRRACEDLAMRRRQRNADAPDKVSVNLSRNELVSPHLIERIEQTLEETGIEPAALNLEITESTVMQDVSHAAAVLARIKQIGVTLAMDDFGTGHSSLACLHDLPFDVLKIDRSFVAGITRNRDFAAMIHAVVCLAENLQICIVAEGVETLEQVALLQAIDCSYGQGFLFAKPMTVGELLEFRIQKGLLRAATDAA